jgi:hypothetical protein
MTDIEYIKMGFVDMNGFEAGSQLLNFGQQTRIYTKQKV